MPTLQAVALGTRRRIPVDPRDMKAYLRKLATLQTINWLVFGNVYGAFKDPATFNRHIEPALFTCSNLLQYILLMDMCMDMDMDLVLEWLCWVDENYGDYLSKCQQECWARHLCDSDIGDEEIEDC